MKEQFNKEGYVIIKNFFNKEEIALIYTEARKLFAIQIERVLGKKVDINNKDEFEKAMFDFFEADFTTFVNTGKQVQHLISLHRLGTDPKIVDLLKSIGYDFPIIGVRPAMQFNSRYLSKGGSHWKLGAHQDWRTGQGSLDSIVMWFPLVDCGEALGSLQILPASHKDGLLKADTSGYLGSIQEDLPEEQYVQTEFEVGDLLVFSAFLVHRSGENVTKNIRWSVQLRYNNIAEGTFQERGFPMPYIYKPEADLVTPNFPEKQHLETVFA
ncbi:phytanoyl-CoA dioxygenase family protein [Emticicia sp. 21SJ11W-3]|uniref:phytanoyl-CoA dioxygenase family protein n=1 Tax=Emticicia sp. 21SJ11W-3 TaxID=2916755 RepID=UPI00209E93F6|nr:phytanoyl-CoA dioxygenase family protein [Emticicia sp. 21SJ11W-3]UTA67635.1 phytanoyl-CoA dioxygenase family protein [Emticicia sp. 21SJ11W-3]